MELFPHSAFEWADRAAGSALAPLAAWILLSGLDDLFIAAAYLCARLSGRLPLPPADALSGRRQRRIAIYVPLWREEGVIAGMLDHNLAAIGYRDYDFFVGAYPNDPGTIGAVRGVAARSARVHLALCPHDGPTSKADCLNWIYQRMLLHERERGVDFELILLHDAEDLVHPEELPLVNYFAGDYDMIQAPVLPLPTPLGEWTHGIYCDDFAEFHGKDLPARWWLGGFIPSSGVGTAFSRAAIEALAVSDSNLIFRPDCLTEDYETGYRLRRLGFNQVFVPVCRRAGAGQPVATREFFPKRFGAALRQRTRWTTGIALQGWARNHWGKTWGECYWFWRDRKGMVGNPVSLAANLIFFYGAGTWLASFLQGGAWGLGAQTPVWVKAAAPVAALAGAVLALLRAVCSASVYGWGFAVWAPVRLLLGNALNSLAALAALNRFLRSVWLGEPLVWLKTEHAYPNLAALDCHKQSIEAILVSTGAIHIEAVEEARRGAGALPLADHLLLSGLIEEEDLLAALMTRHHLPGGDIPSNEASARLPRLVPGELARAAQVVPISLCNGVLRLACPDLPAGGALERLRSHLRVPIEFHLVTRRHFAQLSRLADQLSSR